MSIFLTQKEALKFLNITRMTILRWEEQGKIKSYRTSGSHRRYLKSDLEKLIGFQEETPSSSTKKNVLIYARVSTKKQEQSGNLERQLYRLLTYAVEHDYHVVKKYNEVASGVNENRKELHKVLEDIKNKNIDILLIEYKDRLARFGYKYIETYCRSHGVEIMTLDETKEKDLNEEIVEDMIAIMTSFSARIYGKRGAKKIKKTLNELRKEELTNVQKEKGS